MGAVLACFAAETMCCAISGALKCCCCVLNIRTSVTTRLFYTFGLLFTTFLAWLVGRYGFQLGSMLNLTNSQFFSSGDCQNAPEACWNYFAILKTSLGFVLYHAFFCLLMLGVQSSRDVRAHLHNGWWPIKFVLWSAAIIGCFYIPVNSLEKYWIAIYVFSFIFIIIQAMLLVDMAWNWTESWVDGLELGDENSCWYKLLLIGFTAFFYLCSFTAVGVLYASYTTMAGCGLNGFFVSTNLILIILMSVASVLPAVQEINPRSGLFQAAFMSFYITYLTGSAIATQPSDQGMDCAPYIYTPSASGISDPAFVNTLKIVGLILAFFLLCYDAFSLSHNGKFASHPENSVSSPSDGPDDEADGVIYNYSWFHFVYVIAGMYMTAMLTNWATTARVADNTLFSIDSSYASMWIRIVTSWICAVLYLWTLCAPLIFPNRDFSL